MFIYACICVYAYIYVYVNIYIYICKYIYIYIYICKYILCRRFEINCNSLQSKNNVISLWTLNFSLAYKDLYKRFWKKTEFWNATLLVKQSQSYMKMQVGVWRCYRLRIASMVEPCWRFREQSLQNSFLYHKDKQVV